VYDVVVKKIHEKGRKTREAERRARVASWLLGDRRLWALGLCMDYLSV